MNFKTFFENADTNAVELEYFTAAIHLNYRTQPTTSRVSFDYLGEFDNIVYATENYLYQYCSCNDPSKVPVDYINGDFCVVSSNRDKTDFTFVVSSNFPCLDDIRQFQQFLQSKDITDHIIKNGIYSLYDYLKSKKFNQEISSKPDAMFDGSFLDEL